MELFDLFYRSKAKRRYVWTYDELENIQPFLNCLRDICPITFSRWSAEAFPMARSSTIWTAVYIFSVSFLYLESLEKICPGSLQKKTAVLKQREQQGRDTV